MSVAKTNAIVVTSRDVTVRCLENLANVLIRNTNTCITVTALKKMSHGLKREVRSEYTVRDRLVCFYLRFQLQVVSDNRRILSISNNATGLHRPEMCLRPASQSETLPYPRRMHASTSKARLVM